MAEEKSKSQQIAEGAKVAFDNNDYFDPVLDTIVAISVGTPLDEYGVQFQCLNFVHKSFYGLEISSFELRAKTAPKVVNMVARFILLSEEDQAHNRLPPYIFTQRSVEVVAAIYDLVFYRMIEQPDKDTWNKLSQVRDFLVAKWPSAYPLLPFNRETDWSRAVAVKNAIIHLMGAVIRTHLPYQGAALKKKPSPEEDISISMVKKDHPFLYNSTLGTKSQALLDKVFTALNDDILLPTQVFAPIISMLLSVFQCRHNAVSQKFLNYILGYEAQLKRASKFEKNKLKIRLNRRFNDRLDKVTISFLLNRGFIDRDPSLKTRFENKLKYLVDQSTTQKEKGIMDDSVDKEADKEFQEMKRKRRGEKKEPEIYFYNESHVARENDYKDIYNLLEPQDPLTKFDMSTIQQPMLSTMVVAALTKVKEERLVKALQTVADRFDEIVTRDDYELAPDADDDEEYNPEGKVKDDDDDENLSEEEEAYTLPLPDTLTIEQKKEQLQVIISNFISLSSKSSDVDTEDVTENNLEKVAISRWKSDSWIKILSRMATRGTLCNTELSEFINDSIFNYFQTDIKSQLGSVIEWLNEEYYNETVELEEPPAKTAKKTTRKTKKAKKTDPEEGHEVYIKYAGKVLDTLIPYLDPSDRKSFIRLISELPYLNKELISKVRQICIDPARSLLGFQSLLYLIMFRPPVFNDCVEVLKDLVAEGERDENEQLKNSALKYLKKYAPTEVPA